MSCILQSACCFLFVPYFCLSNVQKFKIVIRLFSGTVRPRRLKLVTHVDHGWMYHVYRNQAAAAYSSLYFFIFLSLHYKPLTIFVTLFSGTVRPRKLSACIVYVEIRLLLLICPFIGPIFFLSNFQF